MVSPRGNLITLLSLRRGLRFPASACSIPIFPSGSSKAAVFKLVPQARPPSFYSGLALIDSPYRDHEGYAPSELISE